MITIITGTPGAGKTLYTVKMIFEKLIPEGRPIFHNINGLDPEGLEPLLHHVGHDGPFKWEEHPDGSIFVFDEIQRQWPAERNAAKVPEEVKALDTHRHRGMDFFLITQAPMGLDSRVRRLIEQHHHLNRKHGIKGAVLSIWEGCNDDPRPPMSDSNAEKHIFRFPAKYFEKYKSASLHTDQFRIPWRLAKWVAALLAIATFASVMLWRTFGPNSEMGMKIAAGSKPVPEEQKKHATTCWVIVSRAPLAVRVNGKIVTVDYTKLAHPRFSRYRGNTDLLCNGDISNEQKAL